MVTQFVIAIRITVILLVITCGLYPLVVWAVGQSLFHYQANGSLITDSKGNVVGSELLAQGFSKDYYFQPRPSAAASGYDSSSSGGTNLGPTSDKLINGIHKPNLKNGQPDPSDFDGVKDLARQYRATNLMPVDSLVPVDAVTRSASGLDPDISIPNADDQAVRIAKVRNADVSNVKGLIDSTAQHPILGFLGTDRVNVLDLNRALDKSIALPPGAK